MDLTRFLNQFSLTKVLLLVDMTDKNGALPSLIFQAGIKVSPWKGQVTSVSHPLQN